jgi:hypothetical protein
MIVVACSNAMVGGRTGPRGGKILVWVDGVEIGHGGGRRLIPAAGFTVTPERVLLTDLPSREEGISVSTASCASARVSDHAETYRRDIMSLAVRIGSLASLCALCGPSQLHV